MAISTAKGTTSQLPCGKTNNSTIEITITTTTRMFEDTVQVLGETDRKMITIMIPTPTNRFEVPGPSPVILITWEPRKPQVQVNAATISAL